MKTIEIQSKHNQNATLKPNTCECIKIHLIYTVCPKKCDLWQVQTCTALHIIKRAQALMYCDYCHQILYKSVVPFSRFSIFTRATLC